MKKYTFLFFMISIFLKGQNYIIINYDTLKIGNCGDFLLPSVTFSNTSTNPVQIHFLRILKNIPTGWTSCFCAPICIAQTQDSLNFTIGIGGTKSAPNTQSVAPNFGTDSLAGTGEVIVIFNEVGVNHFDTITFRGITAKVAGITHYEKETFLVYPNPSKDIISIKSLGKNVKSIQLFNIEGELVKQTFYQSYQDNFKINISEIPSGIYYLSIECIDNSAYRKKIIKS